MVFVVYVKPAWVGVASCLHLICQLGKESYVVSPELEKCGDSCVSAGLDHGIRGGERLLTELWSLLITWEF